MRVSAVHLRWLVRVSAVRTIPERGHELKKHGLVLDLNLRLGRCLILDPALCATRCCRLPSARCREARYALLQVDQVRGQVQSRSVVQPKAIL